MPKLKAINFELIDRDAQKEPYAVLEKMRRHHEELGEANIALAWRENLKADKDGPLLNHAGCEPESVVGEILQ